MNDRHLDERMLRVVIAAASVAMLAILLLPSYSATPDEAKYIGLGLNILDGRGLTTIFGAVFANHSPLWPLILAAPQRYLGLDPLAVGHVLNAVAAAVTVALTGVLGWRVRPAAGALAAVVMLAFPFLASNARTAGLDLPATALTLAFMVVAIRALEVGSTRLALGSGLLFGLAFLTKETALPFFPVPFLAALIAPQAVRRIARLGAAAVLTAAATTAWWFVLDAQLRGTVYRLGTPAWTLLPIAAGLIVMVIVGWNADWIARRTAAWRMRMDVSATAAGRWRAVAAWGGLAAWTLGQVFIYARTDKLAGQSLFRLSQWVADAQAYIPLVALLAGFGLVGVLVAAGLIRRSQGVRELVMATIAGLPLILLVLAIGETPRHYLTSIAVLVALAAAGWVHGLGRARTDRSWAVVMTIGTGAAFVSALRTPGTPVRLSILAAAVLVGVAIWLLRRALQEEPTATGGADRDPAGARAARRAMLAGLATLVAAGAIVFAVSAAARTTGGDRSREEAVAAVAAWVDANVPPGDTIAVGPLLAYETALAVRDGHPAVRFRAGATVVDARTPFGLRSHGKKVDLPLGIASALRNVDQLDVYKAGSLDAIIAADRPTVWIDAEVVRPGDDTTSTTAMLDAAEGIDLAQQWIYPLGDQELRVTAWTVDPDRVKFDQGTTFADARTVEALIRLLRAEGGGPSAAVLADRIVITPPDPRGSALLDELRSLAPGGDGGTPAPSGSPSPTPP